MNDDGILAVMGGLLMVAVFTVTVIGLYQGDYNTVVYFYLKVASLISILLAPLVLGGTALVFILLYGSPFFLLFAFASEDINKSNCYRDSYYYTGRKRHWRYWQKFNTKKTRVSMAIACAFGLAIHLALWAFYNFPLVVQIEFVLRALGMLAVLFIVLLMLGAEVVCLVYFLLGFYHGTKWLTKRIANGVSSIREQTSVFRRISSPGGKEDE